MTSRIDLEALAARVEAAEATDQRTMLEEAWLAIHHEGYPPEDTWDDTCRKCDRFQAMLAAEAYESAALQLVPEGWLLAKLWERNCELPHWRWKAELWRPETDQEVRGIARNTNSPALALAAAALRARSAS